VIFVKKNLENITTRSALPPATGVAGFRAVNSMNVSYATYELEATSSPLRREGALLKVVFDSGIMGYADCHPWPERGDFLLNEQLQKLAQGELTPLTHCALECAFLDGESRAKGKSLFTHRKIPRSHFLVTHLLDCTPEKVEKIVQQGYTHLKLKGKADIEHQAKRIRLLFSKTSLKLRLDLNESLTPQTFRHFLRSLEGLEQQIDFIEDPFPFNPSEWRAIQKEGWVLASDRHVHHACHKPESAQILIIKPALQSFADWQQWTHQTRIVTSYLGHPVGQVTAAYIASEIDPLGSFVHGLLSHHVYRPNAFSRHLNGEGPGFILPSGTGCGFDQELDQLTWVVLK